MKNEIPDKKFVEEMVREMGKEENVESFTYEAYNAKGDKVKYDSKTDKISVVDHFKKKENLKNYTKTN